MRAMTFTLDTSADNIINPEVTVTVTEMPDGSLKFDVNVTSDFTGDLRGLFMHVSDPAILTGLMVDGALVTEMQAGADSVVDLGGGATMSGVKTGPFDLGIELGTSGMAKDDIQSASFTLSSSAGPLTLDWLAQQDFGARLTSVGDIDGAREESRKLFGSSIYPVDARDDAILTDEDTVATGNLFANDVDLDSTTLTVTAVNGDATLVGATIGLASGATVTVGADGGYVLGTDGLDWLSVGEVLTDSFGYSVKDDNGGSDDATVAVTIVGVNDAPTALADGAATDEDHSVTGSTVLANDSDIDRLDTLSITEVEGQPVVFGQPLVLASGALLTMNADGTYLYDPNGKFESLNNGESAQDVFTYTVADGNGGFATASVTIDIAGVSDAVVPPPPPPPPYVPPADHFPVITDAKTGQAHAISNVVLYLDSGSDIVKVKIEGFDGKVYDADNLALHDFVARNYSGMELVALSIKAGNNKAAGMGPGEGQLFALDNDHDVDARIDGLSKADLAAKADATWQYGDWLLA